MTYAIRSDRCGFRAVNDPSDCLPGEIFSLTVPEIEPPRIGRVEVEHARLRAYSDPITGSDRYFAEAQRESLLGNAEAAEAAKALGLARFSEIQADNPWPAE